MQEVMLAQVAQMIFNTRMTYAKSPALLREFMASEWKKKASEPVNTKPRINRRKWAEAFRMQFEQVMKLHGAKPANG